jgi:hypothetical protein
VVAVPQGAAVEEQKWLGLLLYGIAVQQQQQKQVWLPFIHQSGWGSGVSAPLNRLVAHRQQQQQLVVLLLAALCWTAGCLKRQQQQQQRVVTRWLLARHHSSCTTTFRRCRTGGKEAGVIEVAEF